MPDDDFDAAELLIAIDLVEEGGMPDQAARLRELVGMCEELAAVLEVATVSALQAETIGPTATNACLRALARHRGETVQRTLERLRPRWAASPAGADVLDPLGSARVEMARRTESAHPVILDALRHTTESAFGPRPTAALAELAGQLARDVRFLLGLVAASDAGRTLASYHAVPPDRREAEEELRRLRARVAFDRDTDRARGH